VTGNKIPVCGLFEERAAVLSKLGSHDKVLAIYALDLDNSAKAEEYCRQHVSEDKESCKDVYLNLLQVYLKPPPPVAGAPPRPTEPMIEPALKLLSEHYQHINISEALNLLPPTTKLSALMPFFTRVLSESARQRRDGQIVRALLRSESLRVHEEYIAACSPYVYVDENTLCAKCHRPLRTSAFVRYPDTGQIYHMMCHQKTESAAAAAAAAAAVSNENMVDVDQQGLFDIQSDYNNDQISMTQAPKPSLLAPNPAPQSTNPFFDPSPAGSSGPILSSNPFFDDYNPASGNISKPGPSTGTSPFDDDYGGGFM